MNANSRIAKNTVLLYFRSAVILLINLYTSRVVLEALGVDDYGIYNLVGGVVTMFSIIGSTLSAASQRFITYALGKGNEGNIKSVFSTSVTLHFLLALILLLILEGLGVWMIENKLNIPTSRLNIAHWVFQFSLYTFFVNLISVPYNAVIIAHEKMSAFAYISVVEAILKLAIAFLLMTCSFDRLLIYAVLHFVIALIIRVIYTIYSVKHFNETKHVRFKVELTVFKEMCAFSSWNLIGSSALVLRNQGIDVVLNLFFDVAVNAAKGIAYQVQGAIQLFISNFTTAINPQLTAAIANSDIKRSSDLMFHGGRISFFMMMIIAVPFIVVAEDILEIWLISTPDYAVGFVQLTIVMLLCDTLVRLIKNGILAQGNIKYFQLVAGCIKLISLPITYFFLKMGGSPYTGFVINIVIEFICLIPELYFAHKLISFDVRNYIFRAIIPCWCIFIVASSLSYMFSKYITDNMFFSGLISVLISGGLIMLIIEKKELNLIIRPIKSKFCKK